MMKDDEKFADEVFEKISAYERKKKKLRRVLAGVLSGGFACTCACVLIALLRQPCSRAAKTTQRRRPAVRPERIWTGRSTRIPEKRKAGVFGKSCRIPNRILSRIPDSEF